MVFRLSRAHLLPQLDLNAPIFIISELSGHLNLELKCSNLIRVSYRHKLIKIIKKSDYSSDDYADVPIFINKNLKLKWNYKTIHQAYKHISSFYEHSQYKNIKSDFEYGPITPQVPNSIDIIIAYGACIYFGIESLVHDKKDPQKILRGYLSQSLYTLRKNILVNLKQYNKRDLFILSSISSDPPNINYDLLNKLTNYDIGTPQNDYEAIVNSAYVFNLDLTKVSTPLEIYNRVIKNPQIRNYIPNLSQKFNPKLSIRFYKEEILRSMLHRYGYDVTQWSKIYMYNKCHEMYILNTFETGIHRPLLNKDTPLFKRSVETISHTECLSYGNEESGYYIYTFEDLYKCFKYYNQPVRPENTQETFNDLELKQIINICNCKTKYADKIRKKLITILSIQSRIPKQIKVLKNVPKDILNQAFDLFTDSVMYMRGWKGSGEYPIEDTLIKDQIKVDANVSTSVTKLIDFIEQHDLNNILNLPLVEYKNNQYYENKLQVKGYTIGDRIKILGDHTNINSCIRTSSNWFLASIHKYSILLNLIPRFNINKVRKIG